MSGEARPGGWLRRWWPWAAMGVVVVVTLVVASGRDQPRTNAERIDAIAETIKCPTCKGESVLSSQAVAAQDIRDEIARQVRAGRTDDQVRAFIAERIGDAVPPHALGGRARWPDVGPARRGAGAGLRRPRLRLRQVATGAGRWRPTTTTAPSSPPRWPPSTGRTPRHGPRTPGSTTAASTRASAGEARRRSVGRLRDAGDARTRPTLVEGRHDPDRLAELEEERAFLLRSLDDLDREHDAGDLDEHDYVELRDGYTARAAAVLRELEAGRAARPARPPTRWGRVALIGGLVVLVAVGAGVAVAAFSGQRLPGETAERRHRRDRQQPAGCGTGAARPPTSRAPSTPTTPSSRSTRTTPRPSRTAGGSSRASARPPRRPTWSTGARRSSTGPSPPRPSTPIPTASRRSSSSATAATPPRPRLPSTSASQPTRPRRCAASWRGCRPRSTPPSLAA